MNQESLRIILKTYSKGGLTEDEAVQLIEELFNKTTINNFPYISYWPTYFDSEPKKYEITCKTE